MKPLKVQFISADGSVLSTRDIDARLESTLDVPFGASLVRTMSDGKSTDSRLPTRTYSDAELNLSVKVAKGNDLMWAFGTPRKASVESLLSRLGNVQDRSAHVHVHSMPAAGAAGRSLEGSRVFSPTGQQVGIVQSVDTTPGKPSTVVVRPQ